MCKVVQELGKLTHFMAKQRQQENYDFSSLLYENHRRVSQIHFRKTIFQHVSEASKVVIGSGENNGCTGEQKRFRIRPKEKLRIMLLPHKV